MDTMIKAIEEFSTFRISVIASNLSSGTARMLSAVYGISLASWRTLVILEMEGPCTPSEICAKGAIDKAQMSRSRPILEKRGLIRRIPGKTGKRYRLQITRAGSELFAAVNPIARAREANLLGVLTDQEKRVFDQCLYKLYHASMLLK